MAITVPAAMAARRIGKFFRPPDPAGGVENEQGGNQQDGGELGDERESDRHGGREQAPRSGFLQVFHPEHAGEEEECGDREIGSHVAAVRDQVRVEGAEGGGGEAGGRSVTPARPPCHGESEEQRQQNIGAARGEQDRVGIAAVLVQEIDAVLDLIGALAVGSVGVGGEPHRQQGQGADDFRQRRVFRVPGIIPELEIRVAGHNVDAFIPRLGFPPRGTHFEYAHDRQNRRHGRPEEVSDGHPGF